MTTYEAARTATVGNRRVSGALLGLHALTPVHFGTGASLGTVDLPIQRERHTQWPNGAGSALKGVLRDAVRESVVENGDRKAADGHVLIRRLFGSAKAGTEESNAGALTVTDARLLTMPVRSLKGVFACVTCPAAIERLQRDAAVAGINPPPSVSDVTGQNALVTTTCQLKVSGSYLQLDDETLSVVDGRNVDELAAWIVKSLLPDSAAYAASRERFPKQLVVASNDIFTHFSRYATEVVARIALDYGSKTVKKGALFYQEQLPAESLGYSVLLMNESRAGGEDKSSSTESLQKLCDILKFTTLQVGGDETTGKGFCAVRLCRGEC